MSRTPLRKNLIKRIFNQPTKVLKQSLLATKQMISLQSLKRNDLFLVYLGRLRIRWMVLLLKVKTNLFY